MVCGALGPLADSEEGPDALSVYPADRLARDTEDTLEDLIQPLDPMVAFGSGIWS